MPEERRIIQKYYSIGEAAEYLGVSKDTLRRWEKAGKIACQRTPGDRRRYLKEDLDRVLEGGVVKSYVSEPKPQPPRQVEKPVSETPPSPPIPTPAEQPPSFPPPPVRIARDKASEGKEKPKGFLSTLFESKKKESASLPIHYISTPAGPRRINIRPPKLHIFDDKSVIKNILSRFRFINIHVVIFISVLLTTAIATILIFYMLFQGGVSEVKMPKVKIPKIQEETGREIISPVP